MSVYTYQNFLWKFEMCSLLYVSTTSIKVFFFLNQCFPISHQISFWLFQPHQTQALAPTAFSSVTDHTFFSISLCSSQTEPSLSRPLPTALCFLLLSQALQTSSRLQFKCSFLCEDYTDKGFPGGPVAKTPHSQSRGSVWLWSGTRSHMLACCTWRSHMF